MRSGRMACSWIASRPASEDRFTSSGARGSQMVTVVPRPTSLSIWTAPPDRQFLEQHRRGQQLLAPREGEQAADQLGALFGRVPGHAEDLLLLVAELDPALDQADPAQHCREQIVEVVRDAAGQLADRVH